MFKLLFFIFLLNVAKLKAFDADQKEHEKNCTANKDEYMIDPWINNLDSNGNVFSSNIEIVDLEKGTISLIEEVFDFKFDIGEFKFQHRFSSDKESIIEYIKYFKNTVYLSSNNTYKCAKCEKNSSDARKYQTDWMPKEVISDGQVSYNRMLSPSAMLLHFRDKMDFTHQYKFTDENELIKGFAANLCIGKTYMLRFYHVRDTSINKNLIKKIQILKLEKNKDNQDVWNVKKQFNYYHIEIIADQNRHLGENLPIGLGCLRDENDEKGKNFKNPQINNQQYELDFQFIQNQMKNSENQMKYFDPAFTIVGHHKLYFDDAHRLSVNFGQSNSDQTVKSIHDSNIRTIFEINLSTGYCFNRLEGTSNSFLKVDFNDPLSIIKNIPEVLRLQEKNNVYIGTFITRNIACEVYETTISRKINDENQILIITHYYPSLNFKPESAKLPIRIDVRQFSNPDLIQLNGYFIFLINKFHPNLDFARQEIFDISNCMTNRYEYNWFLVEFDTTSSDIENLKKTQLALLDSFKNQLALNPIRIPKIIIEFDNTNTIYFTVKLLDIPAIQNHFDVKINEKLKKSSKQFLTDDERNCAKTCYQIGDCVSYSFCSNQMCSLLYLKNYGSDDKMKIPDDYIKSERDQNCSLKKRIFKLKEDDMSSKDIRSIMSDLNDKIKSGNFILDVKINNDEKIKLKASEIILNVEPGSKQSNYLKEERDLLRGTSENYDQYFSVYNSNLIFDYDKISKQKPVLNIKHSNLGLADCQLQCINNNDCNSFSYCENKLCIVTSLFIDGSINDNVKSNPNCVVSRKNYLASYTVHKNRGVKNLAKEKFVLEKVEDQNQGAETCAKLCSTQSKYDCLSFEYCNGQLKGKPDKEKICLFHDLNLQSEKKQKLEWDFSKSHCDHYTKKHSTNYKEYGMQVLKEYDLVEYTTFSLEKCAMSCDEHGSCNSFDYCIEETNKGDFENIRCRLHTDTYNIKNANTQSPKCSIYTSLKPRILPKKVIYKEKTFTKGLTVLLSFLSLVAGSSIGVLISFLCIRKFFKEDEEDDF